MGCILLCVYSYHLHTNECVKGDALSDDSADQHPHFLVAEVHALVLRAILSQYVCVYSI